MKKILTSYSTSPQMHNNNKQAQKKKNKKTKQNKKTGKSSADQRFFFLKQFGNKIVGWKIKGHLW